MSQSGISGIHHVTAIASEPQPNLDYYCRFLGLRLVKRTVNFDDPGTYHFYYGDRTGSPGSLLTFFPWPGARRGRHGSGQVTVTAFAVPPGSLEFWSQRAQKYGYPVFRQWERFGEPVLSLQDPDGLGLELIASAGSQAGAASIPEISPEHAIAGLHSATLAVSEPRTLAELLAGRMGFTEIGSERERTRYRGVSAGPAALVDLVPAAAMPRGLSGAGVVHHIAFRTPDEGTQLRWQADLMADRFEVTPVMDREYFRSIYFRTPGGILFEIATDGPGFLIDEKAEDLGGSLRLPPMFESRRSDIEAALPPISIPAPGPATKTLSESY